MQQKSNIMSQPMQFTNITVTAKANIYFEGKVVSHSIHFADGSKKTIGLIYPGDYHFGTAAAERMEIISGSCDVTIDGTTDSIHYGEGTAFDVEANSGFNIAVAEGICEYVCSFLP